MRAPVSLTLRLSLLFAAVALLVLAAVAVFIHRALDMHFAMEDAEELELISGAIDDILKMPGAVDDPDFLTQRFGDILLGHHAASLYLTDSDGRVLYVTPGTPDFAGVLRQETSDILSWQHDGHHYRLLVREVAVDTAVGRRTLSAVTAVVIDYHYRFIEGFQRTLGVVTIVAVLAIGVLGWLAARQGYAPLRTLAMRIRQIRADESNARLDPTLMPAELTDLAESFNDMLSRIETSFTQLENFSADIAHELRTPITNLMTQTQVVLAKPRSGEEYREILYSSSEEYERMSQMVEDMLFLAKADKGQVAHEQQQVDLAREVQTLFDYYEAWAEEIGVTLEMTGSATRRGDGLMLRRAFSNLLSNAIRHSPRGGVVRVILQAANSGDVHIVVENSGTPIAPEHLPRLFDRFYRVDASRRREGEGAGLGLAITRAIVEAHGGRISVTSTEEGTRFEIVLGRGE